MGSHGGRRAGGGGTDTGRGGGSGRSGRGGRRDGVRGPAQRSGVQHAGHNAARSVRTGMETVPHGAGRGRRRILGGVDSKGEPSDARTIRGGDARSSRGPAHCIQSTGGRALGGRSAQGAKRGERGRAAWMDAVAGGPAAQTRQTAGPAERTQGYIPPAARAEAADERAEASLCGGEQEHAATVEHGLPRGRHAHAGGHSDRAAAGGGGGGEAEMVSGVRGQVGHVPIDRATGAVLCGAARGGAHGCH